MLGKMIFKPSANQFLAMRMVSSPLPFLRTYSERKLESEGVLWAMNFSSMDVSSFPSTLPNVNSLPAAVIFLVKTSLSVRLLISNSHSSLIPLMVNSMP
ncbi:MAG: hypothetical protein ACLRYB_08630 [Segatella copri]